MPYPPEETHRRNWLLHELKSVALHPGLAYEDFAARLSGKQENATAGKHRADFECRLNAVEFREAHVAQEKSGFQCLALSTASLPR
jgi:hypothetical protein